MRSMRLLPEDSAHGWTPYLWVSYAGFYVAWPFLAGPGDLGWWPHVAGLIAFLALYFRGYWLYGSARLPVIIGLATLGAVLTPINPGAVTFFVFAVAFVGDALRGRAAWLWLILLTLTATASAWWSGWFTPLMLLGVTVFAPLVGIVNLFYADTRRRDVSLRLAKEDVARLAVQAERHRIAADLHDVLGHTLSVVVLKAELARRLLESHSPEATTRAAAEVADIESTAREALASVRRVVSGIQHATMADELVRATSALDAAGVMPMVDARPVDVPAATEHALALVLREAVTNVVRHARCTTCHITLQPLPDRTVQLRVSDDGRGGGVGEGNGMLGMRARLSGVGGRLHVDGASGMTVIATVPAGPPRGGGAS